MMLKKIFSLGLAVAFLFAMASCGNGASKDATSNDQEASQPVQNMPPPTPAAATKDTPSVSLSQQGASVKNSKADISVKNGSASVKTKDIKVDLGGKKGK